MSNKVAQVKMKASGEVKRGPLMHIHVKPSDNGGATVEARFHPAPSPAKPSASMLDYEAREKALTHTTTHDNADDAVDQVAFHLGAKKGKDGVTPEPSK
jgi:hypothetical protein